MEEKEILKETARTVTNKPAIITVDVKPKNALHSWLMSKGYAPKEKQYKLTRLLSGNRFRVSEVLLDVPSAAVMMGGETTLKDMHQLLVNHLDTLIYIAAVGLTNTEEEPSEKLKHTIRWQFTDEELLAVVVMIVKMSHPGDFTNTLVLARGLDVISPDQTKTSLQVPGQQ